MEAVKKSDDVPSESVSDRLQPAVKLTIFVGGDEKREHHSLADEVIRILHQEGIPGATVTKGVMSYGFSRRIHSLLNEITMDNLPLIIEAIGERRKIESVARIIVDVLGEHGLCEFHPTSVLFGRTIERSENNA